MDRDEFIITVYCLVCEHYQVIKNTYPLRRGGFAPALSDEEVLTLERGAASILSWPPIRTSLYTFAPTMPTSSHNCGTGHCLFVKPLTSGRSKRLFNNG